MNVTVREMDAPTARRIVDWQYDSLYDVYDLTADSDDFAAFVDPTDEDDIVTVEG
jgi:hypothetical protein